MTEACDRCGRESETVQESAFGDVCVTCLDYHEEGSE